MMKAQVISFHCVMRNKLGQVLSSSFNREVINQLETGKEKRLEGLIAGLQNLTAGEKRQISVPANQAYGLYDPKLVVELPRSELMQGESLQIGNEILGRGTAHEARKAYRVIRAKDDTVVLDGNHPLAGQDLVFDIEVVSAREAVDGDINEIDYSESIPVPDRFIH